MRTLLAALVIVAATTASFTVPASAGEPNDAAELFTARCMSCHTVPDPAIRTDLAWLDQVNRTS
ncbi:MAG: hypothetical protein V3T86_02910 [Planctomycetota bacterium]